MGHVGPLTLDNVHNGALVEVRMLDEGMEGSHYTAVVLDVCGARCLVRFEELLAETKPKEKMRYLEEWVHLVQLRYPPARRHVGYNLQPGDALELWRRGGCCACRGARRIASC